MSEVKTDKLSPRTDSGTTTLGDSGDTFLVTTGAKIDINGTELILDADADTSITADTDDQIDIKISGADDFQFTANTFTAAASSVVALDDGAVGAPALTNTGDLNTGVYFPAADTVGITAGGTEQFRFGSNPIPGGSKNMIINGSCAVAQRGALSAQGGTNVYTSVDRWELADPAGGQARWNLAQGTSGGVSGKDKWLSATVSTAESAVGASELNALRQKVEGNNAAGLINSSGQIKASTLSFDIKFDAHASSSTSAPYAACVFIYAVDANYTFTSQISIAADNTWERISVSVPALAQAASTLDTTEGYRVGFMLYSGSTYNATSDSWESGSNALSTSAQENLADYAGNIFGVTNIQWEVGSVATDFAHEDYGVTLAKAQRYYQRWNILAAYATIASGYNAGTTVSRYSLHTMQTMRAAPTLSVSDVADFEVQDGGGSKASTNVTLNSSLPEVVALNVTPASSQTVSLASVFGADNSTARWLALSAEL